MDGVAPRKPIDLTDKVVITITLATGGRCTMDKEFHVLERNYAFLPWNGR
jgi:hypothetical protein